MRLPNQPKQETKTASGSCNIKGNISSSGEKIYHVPGGDFYNVTKPEQIFCSKAQAQAADTGLQKDSFYYSPLTKHDWWLLYPCCCQ